MPISRNRKNKSTKKPSNKKVKPKPYQVLKPSFFELQNPFPPDTPFEKRLEVILQIGDKAEKDFEADYQKLVNDYLNVYDPLYLISFCIFYFLSHQEGIDEEAINGRIDFHPFYVEILQAFTLMRSPAITAEPLSAKSKNFYELLKSLNKNQSYRYYKMAKGAQDENSLHAVTLRMEMMVHTLAVRNWAYEPQMQKVTADLAAMIERKFVNVFNFSAVALVEILIGLTELTNERLNDHLKKIRSFGLCKRPVEIFDAYQNSFPHTVRVNEKEREEMWRHSGKNIKHLIIMLMAHADLQLPDVLTFSLEDLQKLTQRDVDYDGLKQIINLLSYKFGALSEHNKDHIFLSNPIHTKPFIQLESGKYFSGVTWLMSHLGIDIMETLISTAPVLKAEYAKLKGKYLENNITALFKSSFPTAEIVAGSQWQSDKEDKLFENDLLVLLNDFAFVVEAKSGTVTLPAKRGAPNLFFETLKELVVEPSEQAIRFQEFLKENRREHHFKTKQGGTNVIDSSKIKYFVPIGITLSNLGPIGCNLKKLTDAKIVGHTLNELAPSISITDLEVIFEILPSESQKVHYLARRREFEAHLAFQGDEMDLFAFYLENGFNIGETEFDKDFHINLTLMSKQLDPFFIGRSKGLSIKKPLLEMSNFWSDLLEKIEGKKGPLWLTACFILLNSTKEDQLKFEKEFNKLKALIKKGTAPNHHNWVLFVSGPLRRQYAIIGFAYENISKLERDNLLSHIIAEEGHKEMRGVLIIGQDLSKSHYPYSVLAGRLETNFFDKLEVE
jgi:hypothetical protein